MSGFMAQGMGAVGAEGDGGHVGPWLDRGDRRRGTALGFPAVRRDHPALPPLSFARVRRCFRCFEFGLV